MLKEYLIGTEVYDRKLPYHPNADSIVRREARRLRSKLKEYYESVGKDHPVFIYYRPGSYVPAFRHQRGLRDDRIATEPSESLWCAAHRMNKLVVRLRMSFSAVRYSHRTCGAGARESAVKDARYNLNNCHVYAPFDALVTNLTISEGAYAHVGQDVFTLIDARTWWAIGNFREGQLEFMTSLENHRIPF